MALTKNKLSKKKPSDGLGKGRKRKKPLTYEEMEEAKKLVKFGATDRELAQKFKLSLEDAETLWINCQKERSTNDSFLESAERRYQMGRRLIDRIQETTLIPISREALLALAEDFGIGVEYQFNALKELSGAWQALVPVGMGATKIEIDPKNVFEVEGHMVTRLFGSGPEDYIPVFPDNRTRLEALKLIGKTTGLESGSKFSLLESTKALKDAEEAMSTKNSGVAYEIVAQEKEPLPEETWTDDRAATPEL